MKTIHLLAIGFIFTVTSAGWFVLGTAMNQRTHESADLSGERVSLGWGPPLMQKHPVAWHAAADVAGARRPLPVMSSDVRVTLDSDPKQRGLLRYRTYQANFSARYQIANNTPVTQTVYVSFALPDSEASYTGFSFRLGEEEASSKSPRQGQITEAVVLAAGETIPLTVTYSARGVDEWRYLFHDNSRVRDFRLAMETDFADYDFPPGTGSSTDRKQTAKGWNFIWSYPDVLAAPAIGMAMPAVLNAGPVTTRIAFYAPVSLLFFFSVLVILGMVRGTNLHPMNYFFLAAAFFAFHLLLAYLVDLLPMHASFAIAAAVSLGLVGYYIHRISRGELTRTAIAAQLAYLVLFSYTFFFQGLTGLSITIGAVATLALLMALSVRVDWSQRFSRRAANVPPPLPGVTA